MGHDSVSPSLPAHVRGLGRVWSCHCLRVAGDHLSLHSTQYCLHHLSPLLREGGGKGEREREGREGREREGREREGGGRGRKEREREGREGKRERRKGSGKEGEGEGREGGWRGRERRKEGERKGETGEEAREEQSWHNVIQTTHIPGVRSCNEHSLYCSCVRGASYYKLYLVV